MNGKFVSKLEFFSFFRVGDCVPGSKAACEAVAQSQGLNVGGCGFNFEGEEGYAPGCIAYNSGTCEGSAFYGIGGTDEDKLSPTIPQSDAYGTRYRPSGYDCAEASSALPSGISCSFSIG